MGRLGRPGLPKWVRLASTVARQVGDVGQEAKLLERREPLAIELRGKIGGPSRLEPSSRVWGGEFGRPNNSTDCVKSRAGGDLSLRA